MLYVTDFCYHYKYAKSDALTVGDWMLTGMGGLYPGRLVGLVNS